MPLEDNIPELKQEHRDLLMLLRAATNETPPPAPPADWVKTLEIARLHQVDLFLYPTVAGWPPELHPAPDLLARWRDAYFLATVNYEQASAQLKEILKTLNKANIPVIPLKGAWLAEKVYAEGAQRPMCDFDLLVPLEKLDQARHEFEALGYTTSDHYFDPTRDKDIHYRHPDRPKMIELHFRVWHEGKTNVVEPDRERLWVGPVEEVLRGAPCLTFPPERQLCYLIQHILHHSLNIGLKAYLDLILLIRTRSAEKLTTKGAKSAQIRRTTEDTEAHGPAGEGFDRGRLEEEARALGVPFGAPFVTRIALDLADLEPTGGLREFLTAKEREGTREAVGRVPLPADFDKGIEPTPYEKKRRMAFQSILEMSAGSSLIKPELADSRHAGAWEKAKIRLGVVFKPPGFIRSAYPEAIKRLGLLGGYWARFQDVARRSKSVRKKTSQQETSLTEDFKNFDERRAIGQWIHEKDRAQ